MKEKKRSQRGDILEYLQTHKNGLTSVEAITLFGATRLSAQIYALKKSGYEIESKNEIVSNRYCEKTVITRYRLKEA